MSAGHTEGKVVFLGSSGVGKSTIVQKYLEVTEIDDETADCHYYPLTTEINGIDINLQIYDFSGKPPIADLSPLYYKTDLAVIVYDVSNPSSTSCITRHIEGITKLSSGKCSLILVGNKIDLEERVNDLDIKKIAERYNALCLKCSAKEKKGISELFFQVQAPFYENYIKMD